MINIVSSWFNINYTLLFKSWGIPSHFYFPVVIFVTSSTCGPGYPTSVPLISLLNRIPPFSAADDQKVESARAAGGEDAEVAYVPT